jgi:hypothetical protein
VSRDELLAAWRLEFYAPVASFRDPLFPGLTHGLPELLAFGMAARSEGGGVDAETYHPIDAGGANPAVSGRVRAGKGGMTIRDRPFLAGVHLTVWLPGVEGDRVARALRRPRWPLRLGRSQDIVHLTERTQVTLEPAEEAVIDHALAPVGSHDVPFAVVHQMAASVSTNRMATHWADYQWCDNLTGCRPVRGAYQDRSSSYGDLDEKGRAVWLLTP